MENSDKHLRDKLNSNQFAFDPAAWEQMEAMLNGKKKRRGFFWWWTGGIAAALLCAFAGYQTHELLGGNKQIAQQQIQVQSKSQQPENSNLSPANEKALNETGTTIKNTAEKEISRPNATKQNQLQAGKPQIAKQTEIKITGTGSKLHLLRTHNKQQTFGATGNASTGKTTGVKTKKQKNSGFAGYSSTGRALAANGKNQNNTGTATNQQAVNAKPNPVQQEVLALSAAAGNAKTEEQLVIEKLGVALLTVPTENAVTAVEKAGTEDVLPKGKKKIFTYSLGAAASVTGTTLGKQAPGADAASSTGLFYNKPSYMAGFTHDFLFVNRVAITNSIMYVQTSFKVSAPKAVSYSKAPNSYTSTVKELAIPIGIKVYPVVKPGFRFYVNAGVINHIKFRETFNYTLPIDTPVNSTSIGNQSDYLGLPAQTEFDNHQKSNDVYSGVTAVNTTTTDFAINNAKRYYTSFYAGAGVEFIVKNHWLFFAEPTFNMTLQKIGVQDKRKYNIGAIGGMRYQF